MSRKRLDKFRRLAQRRPARDAVLQELQRMFPLRGPRTDAKLASAAAFYLKRGG